MVPTRAALPRPLVLFSLFLAACGAPAFDVELRAKDVETCLESEEKLLEAIGFWNEQGTDLCYLGCKVDNVYGPDVQHVSGQGLRGLGEGRQDTLSLYVAWSIEFKGKPNVYGVYSSRSRCSFAGAVVPEAGWSAYAHELGHFMDLNHVDDDNNLMYEGYRSGPRLLEPWQSERAVEGLVLKNSLCGTGQRLATCRNSRL